MANPLYQMLNGGAAPAKQASPLQSFLGNNPMMQIMQAMRDPAGFVLKNIQDIPEGIRNDPNQILGYLQETRGLTNQDIEQAEQIAGTLGFGRRY